MKNQKIKKNENRNEIVEIIEKMKNENSSKSKIMIFLYFEKTLEISEIAKLLEVRYNFVYNVISNYSMKNHLELRTSQKETKKSKIIELLQSGLSINETAKQTESYYQYVFKIKKELDLIEEKKNSKKDAK